MSDARRLRKNYQTPSHPYMKERIDEEYKITKDYGLKNKTEIWKAQSMVRRFRKEARDLQTKTSEASKRMASELIARLAAIKLIGEKATLDDVLGISLSNMLERRLQTIVFKKGLARTPNQARQFIVHGLISVNGRKCTVPGYVVKTAEEDRIAYYGKAPDLTQPKPAQQAAAEATPAATPAVHVPDTKPSIPKKEAE